MIWNPPLKFGVEGGQTKEESERTPNEEVPILSAPASASASASAAELIKVSDPSRAAALPHTETERERERAMLLSGKREGTKLSFAAEPFAEDEDSFSLFLEGCEDRPQTLSSDCVGYHRGWQRSRNTKKKNEYQGPRVPAVVRVPLALAAVDAVDKKSQTSPNQMKMPRFRLSSITEMSQLLSFMVRLRVRTLAFCGVRKLVELVLKYCLSDLRSSSESEHLAECVASYRGDSTGVLICSFLTTSASQLYRTPSTSMQ